MTIVGKAPVRGLFAVVEDVFWRFPCRHIVALMIDLMSAVGENLLLPAECREGQGLVTFG
jgi:hypothetical protein